jgi:hypothetical protein
MAAFLRKHVAAGDWANDQSRIDLRLIDQKVGEEMATRKNNGEKRYLDPIHGWLRAESRATLAVAVWYKPQGRAWGEWKVQITCGAELEELADMALIKHGKDPDAPGRNFTTHSWER